MHIVILMQVLNSFADISEILADELFTEMSVAEFDFLVETSTWGVLEDHVGGIFLFLVVVVEQFDDTGMV